MDPSGFDLAKYLTCAKVGQAYGFIDSEHFRHSAAQRADPRKTAFSVHPNVEYFVTFGRDQNFY